MIKRTYRAKMSYLMYDRLKEKIIEIGGIIVYSCRYTDGSTTCTVVFESKIDQRDKIIDLLRAKLNNFQGWLSVYKMNDRDE